MKTLLRVRCARAAEIDHFFGIELLKINLIDSNVNVSKIQKSAKSLHPSVHGVGRASTLSLPPLLMRCVLIRDVGSCIDAVH